MSTGSHGDNEVEVVVLRVRLRLVLGSLEDKHIFGSLFPGPEPVCLVSLLPVQWPELPSIHLTV